MKTGKLYHTILYRTLSLLMVLTLLSSHMVPLSYATDGETAGEGLLAPVHSVEQPATEEPSPVIEESSDDSQSLLTEEDGAVDDTSETGTLICEKEIHTHDPETCWQAVTVCGMEEDQTHVHVDACHEPRLICQLPVQEAHAHEDACYGITETFHCGKTECEAHTHTVENGCYTPKQVLDCEEQLEAHQHSETCTVMDKNLTCELSTEPHVHSDSCFKTTRTDICTLPETEEHKHSDSCLGEPNLICEITEPAHIHEPACYTPNYICGLEETEGHAHVKDICYTETTEAVCGKNEGDAHVHTEECYTSTERYTCGLVVSEGHEHNENCYKTDNQLTCEKPVSEGHAHTDECKYGLICTKTETEGHQHSDACYTPACSLPTDVPHKHEDACYSDQKILTCQLEAHTHGDSCYQSAGLELINHKVDTLMGLVSVTGNLPAGVVLQAEIQHGASDLEDLKTQLKNYLHEGAEVAFGYDIWLELDGEEYQPEENEEITVTVNVPSYVLRTLGYDNLKELVADLTLFHVHGERVDELVFAPDYEKSTLTFKVSDFSVFIGTVDNGEVVELTAGKGYQFYDADGITELIEAVKWTAATAIVVKPEPGYVITDVKVNDGSSSYVTIQDNAGVYTLSFEAPDGSAETQIITVTAESIGSDITFDLAQGNILFTDDTYSGYDEEGNALTGPHLPTNRYTIMQSNAGTPTDHTVSVGTESEFTTNDFVIMLAGVNVQTSTNKTCAFAVYTKNPGTVAVILKNGTENYLYSGKNRAGLEKSGGYTADGTLVLSCEEGYDAWLKNNDHGHTTGSDNRSACTTSCGAIDARSGNAWYDINDQQHYHAGAGIGSSGEGDEGSNKEGKIAGTNALVNLTIAGGNIHAMGGRGMTRGDSSGGGANIGSGCALNSNLTGGTVNNLKITGGNFELWRTCNSAAIIGGGYRSGYVNMSIYGGTIITHDEVNAEHSTLTVLVEVRAPGIGGGGGGQSSGSPAGATVNIFGGYIETSSQYGAAIGAGSGGSGGSGSAGIVNISGGTIYATTTKGSGHGAGAAIGTGGSLGSGSGGAAKVTISGSTTIYADSELGADIGGGGTNSANTGSTGGKGTVTIIGGTIEAMEGGIGGGRANAGNGGQATVTISGGTINASSIGGGDSKTGNGGTATVTVNGPADITLKSGIGGGQVTEAAGKNGGDAVVNISDGVIRSGSVGGGSTASTSGGKIGSAQITISGGDTAAQFIMAAGAEDPCSFTMTAGKLQQPLAGYTQVKPDGAAVWMDDPNGVAAMSGGTISGCTAENGGAIYMTAGTFTLSGDALISGCKADNGGAVYMGGGTMNINGGSVSGSATKNGGAVYLGNGELNISGGSVSGTAAENGGAAYMGGGVMNISGGSITGSTAAQNGGGVYLGGGELNISGGEISHNTAVNNGGGAYVRNGSIYMSGGAVSGNTATNGAGGGMYVSADNADVNVMIFSGEVSGNHASAAGGAVAVYGKETSDDVITVQCGVDMLHPPQTGSDRHTKTGAVEDDGEYLHTTCPVIKDNTTGEEGGAIYITGSYDTHLNVYCLLEEDNVVQTGGDQLSEFLKVAGGKVVIDTGDNGGYGRIDIDGTVHVTGGQVDLYGVMTNPDFGESISVDITKEGDHFIDHRENSGDPNEPVYYKLQYFENFKDPKTGVVTGRYTAYQLPADETHSVLPVMYAHPGYEIIGWNTDPDGYGITYAVGELITFGEGAGKLGDLKLYAIWAPNVYTVKFDRSQPTGVTIFGEMPDQQMEFDKTETLRANAYRYPGYRFVRWITKDGTNRTFEDKESVKNICQQNGDIIRLYAEWKKCLHDDPAYFTYEAEGNVLIRTCSCEGQRVEVTLDAENRVYSYGTSWPATVDVDVFGEAMHQNDPWRSSIEVDYAVEDLPDGWVPHAGVPTDAGTYKASVTYGGETAVVEYTIAKAFQAAPVNLEAPQVVGNTLSIAKSEPPMAGIDDEIVTHYRLCYYVGGELYEGADIVSTDNAAMVSFNLPQTYTSYYVEVWYGEGRNHLPSESAKSYQVFHVGDTKVSFNVQEGIDYIPQKTTPGLQINISAKNGYFLMNPIVSAKVSGIDYITAIKDGDVIIHYLLHNVPDVGEIVVNISGAQKLATVTASVAERKVFGSVSGTSADISCDSAFTAAYRISGYNTAIYTNLALQFDALPEGTTILMMDKSDPAQITYWNYLANGDEADHSVLLSNFTRMGGEDSFSGPGSEVNLQFIVDYSKTANGCSGAENGVCLTAEAPIGAPPLVKATAEGTGLYLPPKVTLNNVGTFEMEAAGGQQELTCNVTLTHSGSAGATTKWEGRGSALILKPTSGTTLPIDAIMRITDNSEGGSTPWAVSRDSGGALQFVIPLDGVSSGDYTLQLESDMFPDTAQVYQFTAEWRIAQSRADGAPLNGQVAATMGGKMSFEKAGKADLALKVYTEGDIRVFASGSRMIAKIQSNVPQTHTVKAELLWKTENQGYAKTNWWKPVDTDGEISEVIVPLTENLGEGSFCLMITVTHGTEIVREVPYYFLIQGAADTLPDAGDDTGATGEESTPSEAG